ncbi:transposase [Streptomyces sp. NPDC086010]|uniref:transposase n=1 Tax=Streptomyces sp. NPDC086010 TaxID=3365745 RepID=UPI0037D485E9
MTLCETGTRGLLAACFGPRDQGESALSRRLSDRLTVGTLVLADRAFDDAGLLADITGQGAQFLVRSKANRRLPVLALLPDGSYLSRIANLSVRVIEAEITAKAADGNSTHGTYRLLTTLTDHHTDPADRLIRPPGPGKPETSPRSSLPPTRRRSK